MVQVMLKLDDTKVTPAQGRFIFCSMERGIAEVYTQDDEMYRVYYDEHFKDRTLTIYRGDTIPLADVILLSIAMAQAFPWLKDVLRSWECLDMDSGELIDLKEELSDLLYKKN